MAIEVFSSMLGQTMDERKCIYFCPVAYFDANGCFPDAFIDMQNLLVNTGCRQYSFDELPLVLTNDNDEFIHWKIGGLGFKNCEAFNDFCLEMGG